mmetsp:Transcript_12581/g.33808  ORF Transcript_12581/g.33808 Transcript_12581/m.33808 type:complete len:206 (+) Transcript_12581:819-1436(+)
MAVFRSQSRGELHCVEGQQVPGAHWVGGWVRIDHPQVRVLERTWAQLLLQPGPRPLRRVHDGRVRGLRVDEHAGSRRLPCRRRPHKGHPVTLAERQERLRRREAAGEPPGHRPTARNCGHRRHGQHAPALTSLQQFGHGEEARPTSLGRRPLPGRQGAHQPHLVPVPRRLAGGQRDEGAVLVVPDHKTQAFGELHSTTNCNSPRH